MIRNLALDQSKVRQICDKANFTDGISEYLINLAQKFNGTANTISNSLNSGNNTNAVTTLKLILIYFFYFGSFSFIS